MVEFVCEQCKETVFRPVLRRFCSKDCHTESMRLPPRNCERCGKEFAPEKSKTRFCSLDCFNAQNGGARDQPEPLPVPGARWIPLTQGKFTLVDEALYGDLSQYRWAVVKGPTGHWYAKRAIYENGKQTGLYMHNVILNTPAGFMGDHKDGDGLNNRAYNLRVATNAQNIMNSSHPGKTGFKGVTFYSNRYVAKIQANGVYKYLGRFDSAEDAAKAYDAEARKMHGQCGRYNFPEPGERSARQIGNFPLE